MSDIEVQLTGENTNLHNQISWDPLCIMGTPVYIL